MFLCGFPAAEWNGSTNDSEKNSLAEARAASYFVFWKLGGGSRNYPDFFPFGDTVLPKPEE